MTQTLYLKAHAQKFRNLQAISDRSVKNGWVVLITIVRLPNRLDRLPPNYRRAEGYPENLDGPQCYNCVFLRTHQGRYTCKRYLACILLSFICDDWQKRHEALGLDKLELREDELAMIGRHPIKDLQKPFGPKD
ncbi:MAG: hypothetical protein HYW93_08340 [Thaumarchaeota archaeon]|nr:hypothetical protein [Nitrososphaerota archaeon]